MKARLPYSLIIVKVIELERVPLMEMENLTTFVNTLTADDMYSLLNRGNLTQYIQIHLSEKQINFSQLLCAFLKSALNFEHLTKK